MVDLWEGDVLVVDATGVLLELGCGFDSAADGSVFVDVSLHGMNATHASVLRDVILDPIYMGTVFLQSLVPVWNRWHAGLAGL